MIYLQSNKYLFFLISLLLFTSIYCFIKPLVISIDSAYGFLAYKGSLLTHSFNIVTVVSKSNIHETDRIFQSWWSPGQWIYPGMFNYFLGIKLGLSSIIVTILFSIAGFWGYYLVFTHFKFSFKIILFSLILIFCSSTFYYSFIIYQGGEILEFGMFPWFLLYTLRIKIVTWKTSSAISALLILCFIAKTTLLLYCFITLLYKIFQKYLDYHNQTKENHRLKNGLMLMMPAIVCIIFIQLFFISRGPHPTLINHLNISTGDILIPLSSPLNSILSIQQWAWRIEKLFFGADHEFASTHLFSTGILILMLFILVLCSIKIGHEKKITPEYKYFLLFLYVGLSVFFISAYSFNTNIDYSSRHFKLLGFFFIPALLTILYNYMSSLLTKLFVILFCLIAITDVIYLKKKWTANRYISANFFYRNIDNLQKIDSMDQKSYQKLITLDRNESFKNNKNTIVFIESNVDVAMDIYHQCIIQKPENNILSEIYHGKGPEILFCVIKRTGFETLDILKKKFPDYPKFQLIDETDRYSFYIAK